MPEPPETARPFAACPACGLRSRAVITWIDQGGRRMVEYVRTGKVAEKGKGISFRPTLENAKRLSDEIDKSSVVNTALNMYYGAV